MSRTWAEWFQSLFSRNGNCRGRNTEWLGGKDPGPQDGQFADLTSHSALRTFFRPEPQSRRPHSAPEWSGLVPMEPRLLLSASFANPVSYNTGYTSHALIAVDLNGDGYPDLVTANGSDNNISILINDGSGGFTDSGSISVGAGPYSVSGADFDGDGGIDLAVANHASSNVSVLRNAGAATFDPAQEYDAGGVQWSVAAADFDGDGHIDLAVGMDSASQITLLRNNGDGTFSPLATVGATGMAVRGVVAADLSGDGHPDLAFVNSADSTVSVDLNDGTGYFGGPLSLTVGSDPRAITVADFNEDGYLDLAVAGAGSDSVSVLLNNGHGGFGDVTSVAAGATARGIAAADFDGDGHPDLVTADYDDNTVSVLLNAGNATFGAPVSLQVADHPEAVVAADLNGDDHADIATANDGSSNVSVLLNTTTVVDTSPPTPNPSTWATTPYATGKTSIRMVAATATDPSGVEYYFMCLEDSGHDSGWLDTPVYEDTGLSSSVTYTYAVQTRDKSPNQNASSFSTALSAATEDMVPPTPNPSTWVTPPYATGTTSIRMVATTATDPNGVEYYFQCQTASGHSSGWLDTPVYEDTGLSPGVWYTYAVQTRDKSLSQNTGSLSTPMSAATNWLAPVVLSPLGDLSAKENQTALTVSLAGRFDDPNIVGTVVELDTSMDTVRNGVIYIELFDVANGSRTAAPITTANFLHYLRGDTVGSTTYGKYDSTIFHRSVAGFVIQGGGYDYPYFQEIQVGPTITNEYDPSRSNVRGTVAMAEVGTDPNSATDQFFFSLADNSSNLDNQNGGFTVFARVVGHGMDVVDAMAAVPVYQFSSPFDSLPLKGSYTYPNMPAADNVLMIRTAKVLADELTYSVSTDTPALLNPVLSGKTLTVDFMPNQSGTGHVTVRATDVNGDYVESTFTVTVQAPGVVPTIASLTVQPTSVNRGIAQLLLKANSTLDGPGGRGISKVEFFRDANGDGTFEPGTDIKIGEDTSGVWYIQVKTDGWPVGALKVFARAQNKDGYGSSPASATVTVTNTTPTLITPPVLGPWVMNRPAWLSYDLLTSVTRAHDPNTGDTIQFRIMQVINGTVTKDGAVVTPGQTLIGPGEGVIWYPAANATGNLGVFKIVATDGTATSGPATITIATKQVIRSVTATPKIISMPGGTVHFNANINDEDFPIARVEFYYDWDDDGTLQVDQQTGNDLLLGQDNSILGGWNITTSNTSTFKTGTAQFFARAMEKDDTGAYFELAQYSFTVAVNVPPVIDSAIATPATVGRGGSITLTAFNPHDTTLGGRITGVKFYRDANANGKFDAADKLLGAGRLVKGTNQYTLTVSTALFAGGDNKVFAVATDNNLGYGTAVATVTVINSTPTVTSLKVGTEPLPQPGAALKLIATAKDIDGKVAKVSFYYDTNQSGDLDTGDVNIGDVATGKNGTFTLVTTSTSSFQTGDARYFAVATDNDGGTSPAATATGHVNIPPVVDSLTVTGPVLRGAPITLTAVNPHDPSAGGGITRVDFFVDTNNNGLVDPTDLPLGAGKPVPGSGDYALTVSTSRLPAGDDQFIARAIDTSGGAGLAAATARINNNPPTIDSLTSPASTVARLGSVRLTANHAVDVDGKILKVVFYIDSDASGTLDTTVDTKIGEVSSGAYALTYKVPRDARLGPTLFFAQAIDNDYRTSNIASTSITVTNVLPKIGGLNVTPATVTQPANLTLTASNVVDLDGSGLIASVRFYEDVNKNGAVDAADRLLGEDTDATGGFSITIPSSQITLAGSVRFLAVATDADGGTSAPKAATSQVNPPVGIDLIATAASYSPKVFNLHSPGQTLSVSGTVRNQGSKASGPFLVAVLLKNKDTGTEYSLGLIDVTGLAPLANRTVSTTIDFSGLAQKPPAGSYYFVLRADSTGAIAEISELNNDWVSANPDVIILT